LEKRLRGRGTESEEQIAKRMKNAVGEINFGKENFGTVFDHMITNDTVESSIKQFETLLNEHVIKL
jgi:guanylate kinase